MFGELIGAWAAQVWADQGRPDPFVLAELGPGRGTLMRDALRAAARRAGLPRRGAALAGRDQPARCAPGRPRRCASTRRAGRSASRTCRPAPLIVVANEFFDALPIRQFQRADALWRERLVGLDGDGLAFAWGRRAPTPGSTRASRCAGRSGRRGQPGGEAVAAGARRRASPATGGAALVVDYGALGRAPATRCRRCAAHAPADPLAAPGSADLTAHVRFRALAEAARPARAHGPVAQGVFLERLGITARARALARGPRAASRGDRGRASALDPSGRNGKPLPGSGADPGRRPAAARIRRMTLEILTSDLLAGTRHGFFTRRGGASSGIYAGLNCGPGSSDQREAVALNRARVAEAMGVAPERLLSLHQIHSAEVVVAGPDGWDGAAARRRRGHRRPGLALGGPDRRLRAGAAADPRARVVGAAHAGWRGALDGVLEATVAAMERLGARRGRVRAAIGPTISQRAYEVGPEFLERFLAEEAGYERFFVAGAGDRLRFDLPGFVLERLRAAGVGEAAWIGACTYSDPDALLLLPPEHPRRRAGLRPADLGDPALIRPDSEEAGSRLWTTAGRSAGLRDVTLRPGRVSSPRPRKSRPQGGCICIRN